MPPVIQWLMLRQCCKYVECTHFYCLNVLNWLCWLILCHWILPLEHKHKRWSGWFACNASLSLSPSEDSMTLFALSLWSACVFSFLPDWHFAFFSPSLSVISQTVSCFPSVCPSGTLLWWHSSHVSLIKAFHNPPSSQVRSAILTPDQSKDRQLFRNDFCCLSITPLLSPDLLPLTALLWELYMC